MFERALARHKTPCQQPNYATDLIVRLQWCCAREERLSPEQKTQRKSPSSDSSGVNLAISPAVRRAAQASAMKADTTATSQVRARGDGGGLVSFGA